MQTATHDDEEYTMPSVEALMAGTLALLTGYAQSGPDCACRPLMACKIVSNLVVLGCLPQISPQMRKMLGNLQTRWQLQVERHQKPELPETPRNLWHREPGLAQ